MFRTAEMRPVSGASFTPGPWCSRGCHLDFSHHCRLPAAGPFPRCCFHLPEFWLTELAEVHSRSPFPVFPLPVTSGWNAGPWAFSRASHPAVTSDACQERERALSTRPELTADQSTLRFSYLTQTVRPHVAPTRASSRGQPPPASSAPRRLQLRRELPDRQDRRRRRLRGSLCADGQGASAVLASLTEVGEKSRPGRSAVRATEHASGRCSRTRPLVVVSYETVLPAAVTS